MPALTHLAVSRFMSGSGDEGGVIVLSVTGGCLFGRESSSQRTHAEATVCTCQLLPAYLQVWLHTLQIQIDGQVGVIVNGTSGCELSNLLGVRHQIICRMGDIVELVRLIAGCPKRRRDHREALPARRCSRPSCHP